MSAKRICSVCKAEYEADQKFCPNDGSPLRAAGVTDDPVGQIIADRYRLLSTLGEGGMGRVYLAEHVRMGRKCAVKVISPALAVTDDAIARFNREAANASQINHPNVVQVYDFGEGPDHSLYLAMEFVDGETLSAVIRREGQLPLRRAATITRQVADALSAAHHRGIVHRDLKPDNILVTRQHDGTEWVKVVDFGIAKTVQQEGAAEVAGGQTVTTVGVSIGTPEYMSPEQLSGERLDTRTDLYSLGLVFFHLLTGDLPYPRVTSRENLIRRLTTPPRTLADVRPSQAWPPEIQAVLDRALSAELDQRYATAGDFARDLTELVASAPPDPDVTVPMRSAGLATSRVPTAKDRVPVAATVKEVAAPRRRSRLAIALATGVVVVAAASYLVISNRPPAAPPPLTTAAADSGATDTVTTTLPAAVENTTTVPVATADTTPRRPAAQAPSATTNPVVTSEPVAPQTVESAPAPTGGTPAQRIRQALVLRHPFLRANGDSGAVALIPPNAPIPARIAAIQAEVDGHVARGRRLLVSGDVSNARNEFRQAVQEVTNVIAVAPASPDMGRMRDSVTRSLRAIVSQCQTALQRGAMKTSEANFRCQSLVPARFLQGRGRGG